MQLESSVALALPVECAVPQASTQEGAAQAYAQARKTLHSVPSAQAFVASPHRPATHDAHASTLAMTGVTGGAASALAHDVVVVVRFGAPALQELVQSEAQAPQVRASLQAANAA